VVTAMVVSVYDSLPLTETKVGASVGDSQVTISNAADTLDGDVGSGVSTVDGDMLALPESKSDTSSLNVLSEVVVSDTLDGAQKSVANDIAEERQSVPTSTTETAVVSAYDQSVADASEDVGIISVPAVQVFHTNKALVEEEVSKSSQEPRNAAMSVSPSSDDFESPDVTEVVEDLVDSVCAGLISEHDDKIVSSLTPVPVNGFILQSKAEMGSVLGKGSHALSVRKEALEEGLEKARQVDVADSLVLNEHRSQTLLAATDVAVLENARMDVKGQVDAAVANILRGDESRGPTIDVTEGLEKSRRVDDGKGEKMDAVAAAAVHAAADAEHAMKATEDVTMKASTLNNGIPTHGIVGSDKSKIDVLTDGIVITTSELRVSPIAIPEPRQKDSSGTTKRRNNALKAVGRFFSSIGKSFLCYNPGTKSRRQESKSK